MRFYIYTWYIHICQYIYMPIVQFHSTDWQARDAERTNISAQVQRLKITNISAQSNQAGRSSLSLLGVCLFVVFSPSTDWMKVTHIRESNVLFIVHWFKGLISSRNILVDTLKQYSAKYWDTIRPSQSPSDWGKTLEALFIFTLVLVGTAYREKNLALYCKKITLFQDLTIWGQHERTLWRTIDCWLSTMLPEETSSGQQHTGAQQR